MRFVARSLLVATTVVCLLSIGGAMLVAVWVLVPLHWLAARSSGPYAAGAWSVLAALSMWEAAWMISYVATGSMAASLALGVVAGGITGAGFLRGAADHHVGVVARRLGDDDPSCPVRGVPVRPPEENGVAG